MYRQVHSGNKAGAAIVIMNKNIPVLSLEQFKTEYTVAVSIGTREQAIIVVSSYFKYSLPTNDFIEQLRPILDREVNTIVGADVNGHSTLWHSSESNERGRQVENLVEDYLLHIMNVEGTLNTYDRPGIGSSNIDVTLITRGMIGQVTNWSVTDATDSDHRVISFEAIMARPCPEPGNTRYRTDKADWAKMTAHLASHVGDIDERTVDSHANGLVMLLKAAADLSIPRTRTAGRSPGRQPWWSPELTALKKLLERSRRLGQRDNEPETYRAHRNRYLAEIRKAKMATWRALAGDLNVNPWGKAFRWAKRKGAPPSTVQGNLRRADGSYTESVEQTAELLLRAFVPDETNGGSFNHHGPLDDGVESPSASEVKASIWRIKPSKAPGLDGLTAKIVRKAWPVIETTLTRLYGAALRESYFPLSWRRANVIVIPKGGDKDPATTGAYRPISLLPVLGKALETFLIKKIENETSLNRIGEQHGFVQDKSTITAINTLYNWVHEAKSRHVMGTFLDITGAFDNVSWSPLLNQMVNIGASPSTTRMTESYLGNRWAQIKLESKMYEKKMERGCPQGSQLGPTLWKVAMSELLALPQESNVKIIAYADDIALLVGAARHDTVVARTESYLDKIKKWAVTYNLSFSPTKTQVMSIKGGVKPGYQVRFGTDEAAPRITAAGTVRYLGVILDPREGYWNHVESLAEKSKSLYSRLRTLASANGGISQLTSRTLYKGVFLPRVTYASEIWAPGVKLKKSIKKLGSMQRPPLLAMTAAYRTASTNCLSVVAGVLPLDLEVVKSALQKRLKRGEITLDQFKDHETEIFTEWQERYESTDKGEWTKTMIPSVRERYMLPMPLDHYTTQMLTGHGDFKSKLFKFKLVASPNCGCRGGSETVQHVLYRCPRTENYRKELIATMASEQEGWPPSNGAFLKTRKTYEALRKFARQSLKNRSDR
ncbi:unnamed protein product [Macrosiphum euphorbiae]|uniref:Reverse transcriptase domain-containing protein n=2 Tax=Macrosiphum euphorbiae TaxID=13131 RepID=A0AAV0XPE1_9HEMI|nr:unnamed protein product [Macrosiphum euphorbiae]